MCEAIMKLLLDDGKNLPLDSMLAIAARAFLRSLPMLFRDDFCYFAPPDKSGDVDEDIDNIFMTFSSGMNDNIDNDVALFEMFHLIQYAYAYLTRVEFITQIDHGLAWKIHLQADNYRDFFDREGSGSYTYVTSSFNAIIEAVLEVVAIYHGSHEALDAIIVNNDMGNVDSDFVDKARQRIFLDQKFRSYVKSAEAHISVAIESLSIASKEYNVGDFFQENLSIDIEYLSIKQDRAYDKRSFFNNQYAEKLLARKLFINPCNSMQLFMDNLNIYLNNNESKFKVWQIWYDDRISGQPINPEIQKKLTDIPDRLSEEAVENKHKYIFERSKDLFKKNTSLVHLSNQRIYQVAVSFAGEDRSFVDEYCSFLKESGVSIFYDDFEQANLWGKNLYQYFNDIYKNKCDYCVVFISKNYAEKAWTKHELESAQARAFQENKEYILPVRLDSTELPGVNETTCYVDAREMSPKTLSELTIKKLRE